MPQAFTVGEWGRLTRQHATLTGHRQIFAKDNAQVNTYGHACETCKFLSWITASCIMKDRTREGRAVQEAIKTAAGRHEMTTTIYFALPEVAELIRDEAGETNPPAVDASTAWGKIMEDGGPLADLPVPCSVCGMSLPEGQEYKEHDLRLCRGGMVAKYEHLAELARGVLEKRAGGMEALHNFLQADEEVSPGVASLPTSAVLMKCQNVYCGRMRHDGNGSVFCQVCQDEHLQRTQWEI